MHTSRFKLIITVLAGVSVCTAVLMVYLFLSAAAVSPESLRNDGLYVYDAPIQIGEFDLLDQNGEPFTRENFNGKWSLVFFGYTFCPDICPLTLATLKQFHDLLEDNGMADEVQVVMVSVDPQRDTPEVLSDYVGYFNPEFIGVTGDYPDVFNLSRQMNVAFSYTPIDDENYLVNHSGEIMLLTPTGEYLGFFKATHNPPDMLENFKIIRNYWNRISD